MCEGLDFDDVRDAISKLKDDKYHAYHLSSVYGIDTTKLLLQNNAATMNALNPLPAVERIILINDNSFVKIGNCKVLPCVSELLSVCAASVLVKWSDYRLLQQLGC